MNNREGEIVPFHLNPGIVAASYFVSLTGACLAVELVHVRTALKGHIRWHVHEFELAACACAMGLVGIWAMHYVGNWSIVMDDGQADMQLLYSPGWTALSAFIPIFALFIAFAASDRRYKGGIMFIFYLLAPGILAGAAVCGMHYAGNYGIVNYVPHFQAGYVAGAILVACFACVAALASLFILQDLWMSIFPLRLIVAIVLAATVSAMHWIATVGTYYTIRDDRPHNINARQVNFIVALAVCLATVPAFCLVRWWQLKRQRQLAERTQQVILACARFDPDGRLLVSQEGHLPSQRVSVTCNGMGFDDDFDTNHAAFRWIYRASHNWRSVSRFVPRMRRHLQEIRLLPTSTSHRSSVSEVSSHSQDALATEDYSLLFREAFCVAASDLASDMRRELDELGSLYDEVMVTGTSIEPVVVQRYAWLRKLGFRSRTGSSAAGGDIGFSLFGRGQLLVLASQCSKRDVSRHIADGYRFEALDKVQEQLAKNMEVPPQYLEFHLQRLRGLASGEQPFSPRGTILGFFAIRPGVVRKTWDVLVRKDDPSKLPCVQISPKSLDADALAVVQQLDGMTVAECCRTLEESAVTNDVLDSPFSLSLRQRIARLSELVTEPAFQKAVLSANMVKMPTYDRASSTAASCQLLVFHIILDVHSAPPKASSAIIYTPLSFFQCRQRCLPGASHHASFERNVHQELETLLASKTPSTAISTPRFGSSSHTSTDQLPPRPTSGWWFSKSPIQSVVSVGSSKKRNSSQDSEMGPVNTGQSDPLDAPYGGVLISQDVRVETVARTQRDDSVGFLNFTGRAWAGGAATEEPTYVDQLFVTAVEKWQRNDRVSRRP